MSNTRGRERSEILQKKDKEDTALQLRIQGLTFSQIASHFGITSQTAAKFVRRALARADQRMSRKLDRYRMLECQRLEALHARLWPLVDRDEPDLEALDRLLKVFERRAKLLGIDGPSKAEIKSEVSGPGGGPIPVLTGVVLLPAEIPVDTDYGITVKPVETSNGIAGITTG